jgi:copper chaperone
MTTTRSYQVPGISCGHCKAAIEGEVSGLDGVVSVVVDIDARAVTVTGEVSDEAVRAAIVEAGYEADPAT